jgi:ABC-type transport system substrate-binding protein
VRQAVNYALDRQAINEAVCLGYCPPAGVIIPRAMDYALQVEPPPYDPSKARQLLAEAGYPTGFDAGEFVPMPPFFALGEAIVNQLKAVGIQVTMRPMPAAHDRTGDVRADHGSAGAPRGGASDCRAHDQRDPTLPVSVARGRAAQGTIRRCHLVACRHDQRA